MIFCGQNGIVRYEGTVPEIAAEHRSRETTAEAVDSLVFVHSTVRCDVTLEGDRTAITEGGLFVRCGVHYISNNPTLIFYECHYRSFAPLVERTFPSA
jgi:hypothetical protein